MDESVADKLAIPPTYTKVLVLRKFQFLQSFSAAVV